MLRERSLVTPEELLNKLVEAHASDPENFSWEDITSDEKLKKKLAKWLVEVALTLVDSTAVNRYIQEGGGNPLVEEMLSPADEAMAAFSYLNNYDHWEVACYDPETLDIEAGIQNCLPRQYTNPKGRKKRAGPTAEGMRVFDRALCFFSALRKAEAYAEIMEACEDYWKNESQHFRDIMRRGQYRNKKKSSENQMDEEEDGEAGELDANVLQAFGIDSNDDGSSKDSEQEGSDNEGK